MLWQPKVIIYFYITFIIIVYVLGEEYWMGLENIYQITNNKAYSLRITMKSFESPVKKIATYKIFKLTENVIFHTLITYKRVK